MYNMNISLFGIKMNIMTIIFIVIFLILVSHTFCGCQNNPYALIEGVETMNIPTIPGLDTTDSLPTQTTPAKVSASEDTKKTKTNKSNDTTTEGFTGANINYGQSSPYDIKSDVPINTSSWGMPNMVVTPGQKYDPAVKAFLDRPKQQLPLPEDEMVLFYNTQFKPECCPNTYSTSTGCACMTSGQYNYLITRGSNNVPYSEY